MEAIPLSECTSLPTFPFISTSWVRFEEPNYFLVPSHIRIHVRSPTDKLQTDAVTRPMTACNRKQTVIEGHARTCRCADSCTMAIRRGLKPAHPLVLLKPFTFQTWSPASFRLIGITHSWSWTHKPQRETESKLEVHSKLVWKRSRKRMGLEMAAKHRVQVDWRPPGSYSLFPT